jgi:lipoprotein-anchoring transpeptidase ErfK/SrfK
LGGKSGVAKKVSVDTISVPGTAEILPEEKKEVVSQRSEQDFQPVDPLSGNLTQENIVKESFWTKDLFERKEKVIKPPKPAKEKPVKAEKVKKEKFQLKTHHKIAAWIVVMLVVTFLTLLVAGGAFAHEEIYKNKVFPGVVVWGQNVGGKSMQEVTQIVTDKVKSYKVNLVGPDQNYNAGADDLGLVFDPETISLSAYSKGRTSSFWDNYLTRARLLIAGINWSPLQKAVRSSDLEIRPKYTVNDEALNQFIDKISSNIKINPQDSKVTVEGQNVRVVPAVFGRNVEKTKLKTTLLANIQNFNSNEVRIETTEVKPNVIDKAAEEVRVQSENVISRPVILTYQGTEYRPDKATVASWISFTKAENATNYTLAVDTSKMSNYFNFLGSKINIYSIPQKITVENGVKQTVTQDGKDGLLVDSAVLGRKIAELLPNQPEVRLAIPTYVSKFKTEYTNVVVADWEKYIDINISTQTMTAYTKGGNVVGSWKVTTGNRYHPTPVGTWLVVGKSAVTRMTGGTPGVDYYDLPNVHWVSWFKGGGYSIHEAYWRSSFGGQDYVWNGSHGCVNSPIEVAHFIYDWAPVGTPVIVHY